MADTGSFLAKFLYGALPKFNATTDSGVSGTLDVDTTSASTAANQVETTLWTYNLPANALSSNGKAVRITAWGFCSANTNTKTIQLYFGSTVLRGLTTIISGAIWQFEAIVVRTGASAQTTIANAICSSTTPATANTTPAEDTTAAITIKVTGLNGSAVATEITYLGSVVEALN